MRRRQRPLLAAGLGLAAAIVASQAAAQAPNFVVAAVGAVVVAALPAVLGRPEVRSHLESGLTTTLLVRAEVRPAAGGRRPGAARVDVRWEPWDEVFFVTTITADGTQRHATVGSFEELVAWWRALALMVTRPPSPGAVARVDVELDVVPFSHAEQRDAQRWFSGSLAPEGISDRPQVSDSAASSVVDLLMATSIQRRSVVRYAWRATPQARAPQ